MRNGRIAVILAGVLVGAPNGNVWENNRYEDGAVIGRVEE